MKLSQYVLQLCAGLESDTTDDKGNPGPVSLTFNPQDVLYRRAIARMLRIAFCGSASNLSDELFGEVQYCRVQASQLESQVIALQKEVKSKDELQEAPKRRGRIPKAKIEQAVKDLREKKE